MQYLRHKLLCLQVIFLLFAGGDARAYDIFSIDNVYVDQAAENPTAARERAIDEAQAQAYGILIKSILDANLARSLPKLTPEGIAAMVKSFEITGEKVTGNRYQARFDVAFDEAAVKSFLATNNVGELEIRSPPILVLPVFETETGALTLWEPSDPWRTAWGEGISADSPMRLIVPVADLQDVQTMSGEDIAAGRYENLLAFANRYGAREVMIARAKMKDAKTLTVTLQPVGDAPALSGLSGYTEEFSAEGEGYYPMAVASIIEKMEAQWQGKGTPLAVLSGNRLSLIAAIEGAKDWVNIRHRLEAVAPITHMDVKEVSMHRAVVEVEFSGNFREFQQALDERGLELLQEQDSYIIREATPL